MRNPRRVALLLVLLSTACAQVAQDRPVTPAAEIPFSGAVRFASYVPPSLPTQQPIQTPLPALRGLAPERIPGTFVLPSASTGRLAAVVILHGSAGVDGRGALYAADLAAAGIASIEVDMWTPRGVPTGMGGIKGRPSRVTETLPDAYGALRWLASHPRIDPDRIGVMGMSWGAMNAIWVASPLVRDAYAADGPQFRAAASLYPLCWYFEPGAPLRRAFENGWPTMPVLLLAGGSDDYDVNDGGASCQSLAKGLPDDRRPLLDLHVYAGATHAWDGKYEGVSVNFFDPTSARGRGGNVHVKVDAAVTKDGRQRVTEFFLTKLAQR